MNIPNCSVTPSALIVCATGATGVLETVPSKELLAYMPCACCQKRQTTCEPCACCQTQPVDTLGAFHSPWSSIKLPGLPVALPLCIHYAHAPTPCLTLCNRGTIMLSDASRGSQHPFSTPEHLSACCSSHISGCQYPRPECFSGLVMLQYTNFRQVGSLCDTYVETQPTNTTQTQMNMPGRCTALPTHK